MTNSKRRPNCCRTRRRPRCGRQGGDGGREVEAEEKGRGGGGGRGGGKRERMKKQQRHVDKGRGQKKSRVDKWCGVSDGTFISSWREGTHLSAARSPSLPIKQQ